MKWNVEVSLARKVHDEIGGCSSTLVEQYCYYNPGNKSFGHFNVVDWTQLDHGYEYLQINTNYGILLNVESIFPL